MTVKEFATAMNRLSRVLVDDNIPVTINGKPFHLQSLAVADDSIDIMVKTGK